MAAWCSARRARPDEFSEMSSAAAATLRLLTVRLAIIVPSCSTAPLKSRRRAS
jgi:hypothetical protein